MQASKEKMQSFLESYKKDLGQSTRVSRKKSPFKRASLPLSIAALGILSVVGYYFSSSPPSPEPTISSSGCAIRNGVVDLYIGNNPDDPALKISLSDLCKVKDLSSELLGSQVFTNYKNIGLTCGEGSVYFNRFSTHKIGKRTIFSEPNSNNPTKYIEIDTGPDPKFCSTENNPALIQYDSGQYVCIDGVTYRGFSDTNNRTNVLFKEHSINTCPK